MREVVLKGPAGCRKFSREPKDCVAGPLSNPGRAWPHSLGTEWSRGWNGAAGRFQHRGQTSPRLRAARRVGRPSWGKGWEERTLIATHPQRGRGGTQRGRREADSVGQRAGVRRNAPLCARSLSLFWRAQPTALQRPPPARPGAYLGRLGCCWAGFIGCLRSVFRRCGLER